MVLTLYGWAAKHYTPPEKSWKESPVLKGVYRKGDDFLVLSADPIDAANPVLSLARTAKLPDPFYIITEPEEASDCVKWIKSFGESVRIDTLGPEGLNARKRDEQFSTVRELLDAILSKI